MISKRNFCISALAAALLATGAAGNEAQSLSISERLDVLLSQYTELRSEHDSLRARVDVAEGKLDALDEAIEALPDDVVLIPRIIDTGFDGITTFTNVPGATDAFFCALSRVDDDSPQGSCRVRKSNGVWQYQAGGDSGDNHCRVICLFLKAELK